MDAVEYATLAAIDLARGRNFTSFVWLADVGGVFVEIFLGSTSARLIVHEMKDPNWGTQDWFPERAEVLFRLSKDSQAFVEDFFGALIDLPAQVAASDRSVWGRPLPEEELRELQEYLSLGKHHDLYGGS